MFVEHTPTVFFVSAVDCALVLLESDFFSGEDAGLGVFGAGVVSGTFCERLDRYFLVFL